MVGKSEDKRGKARRWDLKDTRDKGQEGWFIEGSLTQRAVEYGYEEKGPHEKDSWE